MQIVIHVLDVQIQIEETISRRDARALNISYPNYTVCTPIRNNSI